LSVADVSLVFDSSWAASGLALPEPQEDFLSSVVSFFDTRLRDSFVLLDCEAAESGEPLRTSGEPFGSLYYSDYESVNECLEGVCNI